MTDGLLTLIIFLPVAGVLVLLAIPRRAGGAVLRASALGIALAELLLSVGAALQFDLSPAAAEFQFVAKVPWIPEWGASYHVGLDGLSLSLVLLTNFLAVLSILSSFSAIRNREKEYYILLLLLQSGVLGTFLALDLLLFYLFWELMLIPLYFLIGIWGSENRVYATMKFLVYTLVGSLLMLVGILVVYFHGKAANAGVGTFDYLALARANLGFDSSTALWTFLAFLLAFAIKVPIVPFHTWLPDAHTEAPTAGSVLLAGILLKTGVYGIVRFCIPFFPESAAATAPLLVALALAGIIYGAFTALAQTDMKRLVAYSSVSHMGFVILGIFAFQEQAVRGGLLQMLNHGISTGGLFLCVGMIYERRHTRRLADFGGLAVTMRRYAALTVIVALSSLGLPGLNGFVGEFLVIVGAFQRHWYWAALAGTGVILGAVYLLVMVQRVFFGPLDKPENRALSDLSLREVLTLLPVVVMAFAIGLYPKPWLKMLERSSAGILARIETARDMPREVLVEGARPLPAKDFSPLASSGRAFESVCPQSASKTPPCRHRPIAQPEKSANCDSRRAGESGGLGCLLRRTCSTCLTRPTCPICQTSRSLFLLSPCGLGLYPFG